MKTKTKIIFGVIAIVIILLIVLVSINLFGSIRSSRTEGNEDYKLTKDEINEARALFEKIEEVGKFNIRISTKTIKIDVLLTKDVNVDTIKKASNEMLEKISNKNKLFYDIEISIDTKEESEHYPINGHKHKTSKEFVW